MSHQNKPDYDLNDATLVSVIDDLSLWSAPFGMKLLDKIQYKKGINALDIGFGTGFPLLELAMRLGNTSALYGLDPWNAGTEKAQLRIQISGLTNVRLFEGVAELMPFENEFFDLITSNNGLNNVQDLRKSLLECSRVSKKGAQLVFTYNTADSFIEFYDVFREVINKNGLQHLNKEIDAHIYSKRKPLPEFEEELGIAGFAITSIQEDTFYYRFADGTSFFNHFFIKLAFMDSWKNMVPESLRTPIFLETETLLNKKAEENEGFSTQVPFYVINATKI